MHPECSLKTYSPLNEAVTIPRPLGGSGPQKVRAGRNLRYVGCNGIGEEGLIHDVLDRSLQRYQQ
jgi:hypothetical protein